MKPENLTFDEALRADSEAMIKALDTYRPYWWRPLMFDQDVAELLRQADYHGLEKAQLRMKQWKLREYQALVHTFGRAALAAVHA